MTRDWVRLGAAIKAGYQSLGVTQRAFATASGVSLSTLQRLERGDGPEPQPKTLAGVERALGWPAGAALEIASGSEAPPAQPREVTLARPAGLDEPGMLERLPEQIRHELAEGELLGVDVVDLGPDDSGARIVVIVKRDSDAPPLSPEQTRELMAQWRERQRMLRQPPSKGA